MTLIGVAIARSTCVNLSFNKLMSKTKKKSINSNLKEQSFHNILNVDTLKAISIAIALTIAIYVICFLIGDSYLKSLLYERGFTQYIVVLMASSVTVFIALKYRKIALESKQLNKNFIDEKVNFENYQAYELVNLQRSLSQGKSFIAVRISRVVSAYINSGNRSTVAEFISDDSSFYTAASASSYVLPRILIWAIPLLGFVGTVMGISSAVNGFTSFLSGAEEIDQIKEGIGFVTTGLAVAFDTTLLALLLSVLVMLPLVAVERMESQLLLAVDIYLNDRLLVKLKDKPQIEPEPDYSARAEKFVTQISEIKAANTQLLEQVESTTKALEQRIEVMMRVQELGKASPMAEIESSGLDEVLSRINDNLAQIEPVLKELNLPRRLVLVEEKDRHKK